MRTLTGLMAKGAGFTTSSVVSFGLDPHRNGYFRKETSQLIRRIYDELRTSPSTQTSAVSRFQLLTGGSWNNPMTIQSDRRITTDRDVNLNAVRPGFFATLGIRLFARRDFDARDSRPVGEAGLRSAIVNESFVRADARFRGTVVSGQSIPDLGREADIHPSAVLTPRHGIPHRHTVAPSATPPFSISVASIRSAANAGGTHAATAANSRIAAGGDHMNRNCFSWSPAGRGEEDHSRSTIGECCLTKRRRIQNDRRRAVQKASGINSTNYSPAGHLDRPSNSVVFSAS